MSLAEQLDTLEHMHDATAISRQVHPEWQALVAAHSQTLDLLDDLLRSDQAGGYQTHPSPRQTLAALRQPLSNVRVLIIGQDPYPTPGHAMGLAFSVQPNLRTIPRSLGNIYRELHDDLGHPPVTHGDLSHWSAQGVLLLNRVLSVRSGQAGSHRGKGWEPFTQAIIETVAARGKPLVSILWGKEAQTAGTWLQDYPVIASAHPSPLSASRGFFGSRPFSTANHLLQEQSSQGIHWQLPER